MMYGSFLYVLFHEANVINVIIKNALLHVKTRFILPKVVYMSISNSIWRPKFSYPRAMRG